MDDQFHFTISKLDGVIEMISSTTTPGGLGPLIGISAEIAAKLFGVNIPGDRVSQMVNEISSTARDGDWERVAETVASIVALKVP